MPRERVRPGRLGSDQIETDGVGPPLSGGGSDEARQAEQPAYTQSAAASSTGGLIASVVVAVALLAIPIAWGTGVVSALARGLGLQLSTSATWLVYAGFVVLVVLIVWLAWNLFTKSFTDIGQYPR